LHGVAERLRARSVSAQTCVVVGENPAEAILDVVRTRGLDLVALETHGRRGLNRLLLGSVADKVVRGASTPVLVDRAAAA
jgi:nucleotide-binding universal stress UspA family protein